MSTTHPVFAALAEAFSYPAPGRLAELRGAVVGMPEGAAKDAYAAFVRGLEPLNLGAWEELHTRTLDLDPPGAPYVGYQMWGDSYQRGRFLANMNRALAEAGVDRAGELPDHLAACLRYLAVADDPVPDLVEACGPAVEKMLRALREAQPDNPYVKLMMASQAALQEWRKEVGERHPERREAESKDASPRKEVGERHPERREAESKDASRRKEAA